MNMRLILLSLYFWSFPLAGWAMPSTITYQGALKDKGVPASGSKQMQFRITNQAGTQVYWSSGNLPVQVSHGHFAVQLNPSGVPWETVDPYIEVTIEGQQLLPREPVSATVYANIASSIADGSVSPSKVTSGFGLVPSGMIALFDSSCPVGWSPFTQLNTRFPLGGATSGVTGGSATHSHGIALDGQHAHGGSSGFPPPSQYAVSDAGLHFGALMRNHSHPIGMDGSHQHGGATAEGSSLPPYYTVVFCRKT